MPANILDSFLQDPAYSERRKELAFFVGPNAEKFLAAYDAQIQQRKDYFETKKIKFFQWSFFTWPAFFTGPVWFFYRRMWAWGWGITIGLIVLALIPGINRISFPIGIMLGAIAKRVYIDYAMRQINALHASGNATEPALIAAGGVSTKAGWIAGVIFVIYMILSIAGLIYLGTHGAPLR